MKLSLKIVGKGSNIRMIWRLNMIHSLNLNVEWKYSPWKLIETNDLWVIDLFSYFCFFFCFFLASSPSTTLAPPSPTTTPERSFEERIPSKNMFETSIYRQRDNHTIRFTDKGKFFILILFNYSGLTVIASIDFICWCAHNHWSDVCGK